MYSTNDCSGDAQTFVMPMKMGECKPESELDDNGTSWEIESSKVTRSGTTLTFDEYSTGDCSGTASKTETRTCGVCNEEDDGKSMMVTCPPEDSADPGAGVGNASGTFRPPE